jgi:hypothetical protein
LELTKRQEAQTGEIDLSDEDPEIVDHMMNYFYKGYYDFEVFSITHSFPPPAQLSPPPSLRSRILGPSAPPKPPTTTPVYANSMDIHPHYTTPLPNPHSPRSSTSSDSSQTLRPAFLSAALPPPSRIMAHASVYILAEQYDIAGLKSLALGKYASLIPTAWKSPYFIPSLKLIFENTPTLSTPDSLRLVAARAAAEHAKELLDRTDFLELLNENGEIAIDILRMSLVLRQEAMGCIGGKWVTRGCRKDRSHDVVYVPGMVGIGTTPGTGGGMGSLMGFGNKTVGRYKCTVCGTFCDNGLVR